MDNEINEFCNKCKSPYVGNKWGDGNYYCPSHEPTNEETAEILERVSQRQSLYEQANEINFLIEFYKNLSWMLDSAEKDKHEEMEIISGENWRNIQIIREEVLKKITETSKKFAEKIEENPN